VQSGHGVREGGDDRGMEDHPIFARFYDRLLAKPERSGLAEMRRELLAQASGRTLELGAGTGHNLAFYTDRVSELVLSEPDPHMARRLREQLESDPPAPAKVEVIEAQAEDLPYDDGSFDTVVSTLVFCTVEDPARAVAEARRLLVEGGALLFLEHVRSENRRLAWWQDRLERPWGFFAGGCHPNRATEQTLADAGLWIERLDRDRLPAAPRVVKPLIRGLARRPD
jgi:ubiquinone/menaquinone biosynthesis C-methylase UbiE